ncbi:MAG TPA: aspartate dehydrogenase [Casimicrobiaceae bacterium]|nr:aspartate dehydrogenase [Casimicrobiaceae bacterium]
MMRSALLIGYGAIGRLVLTRGDDYASVRITHVLERATRCAELQDRLGAAVRVIGSLDEIVDQPDCAIECAGHAAVGSIVGPLLSRGIDVALVSIGALAEEGLHERLEAAARQGGAQLTLIAGAIGGIDALASARLGGLDEVTYTSRKPPLAWRGTPAEASIELAKLETASVFFQGTARDAARLYPKNANVAATVALAGIGFDRTRVSLIADPGVTQNQHRIVARGAFGSLDVAMTGAPLADNAKTSSLAAYSALRALRDFGAAVRF